MSSPASKVSCVQAGLCIHSELPSFISSLSLRFYRYVAMLRHSLLKCLYCNVADEENFNPTERKADGGFIEYLRVGGHDYADHLSYLDRHALQSTEVLNSYRSASCLSVQLCMLDVLARSLPILPLAHSSK